MKKVIIVFACMLLLCGAAFGCSCRTNIVTPTAAPTPTQYVTQRPTDTPNPTETMQNTENPDLSPNATNELENTANP